MCSFWRITISLRTQCPLTMLSSEIDPFQIMSITLGMWHYWGQIAFDLWFDKKMIFSARIALHPERNDIKKNIDCMKKEIQSIIKIPRCSNVECSKVCVEIAIALPRDELQWLVMPALQCYLKDIAVVSNKMVVACEQIRSSNSGNVCGEVGSEKYSSRCQLKDLPHFFETNC